MKRFLFVWSFGLSIMLSGCKGCLSRFYGVHEEVIYTDIIFKASVLTGSVLIDHLDHDLRKDTAYCKVYPSFRGLKMGKKDRIVHFKKDPEEYYWVSVDKNPCNIVAILNNKIDSDWVFTMARIEQVEVDRMGRRFLNEILLKLDSSTTFRVGPGDR